MYRYHTSRDGNADVDESYPFRVPLNQRIPNYHICYLGGTKWSSQLLGGPVRGF
jgi:hypothetical protein